MDRMVGR